MKDIEKIREAVKRVIRHRVDQPHVGGHVMVGTFDYADLRDLKNVLEMLDLSTSNGMTEEEIERIASEYDQDELNDSRQDGYVTSADVQAFELGIKCGLRYARDRGMIASSNVPVVTHLNMDPNASTETKEAVRDMIQAAYAYTPPASPPLKEE